MITNQSAEEIELAAEESTLRGEAVQIDPPRAEDATHHDDAHLSAEQRAAAAKAEALKKTSRPAGDKKAGVAATKPAAESSAATQPKALKPGEPAAKPEAGRNDATTAPTPFQKERRRLDDTWKHVEKTKTELTQREQQLADRERRLATAEQQRPAATTKRTDGITPELYDSLAADYTAEGKTALATQARAKAAELRAEARTAGGEQQPGGPRERFTAAEVETMTKEWQENLTRLGTENPELQQDGTPLRTSVAEILKSNPALHTSGAGIVLAVEHAKAKLKATQVDELTAKLTALEQENEELKQLTSLPTGGGSPGATARKFEDMNSDDQEAALREDASRV